MSLNYDKRHSVSSVAAVALEGYRFASFNGGYAVMASEVQGVTEGPVAAGGLVSLVTQYSYPVESAGVIEAGDEVGPALDGSGRAAVLSQASGVCGRALTSASAAGTKVVVLLMVQRSLSTDEAVAVQMVLPKGTGALSLGLRQPITKTGTYVGTAAALTLDVGFVPDLFIVKAAAAATRAYITPHRNSWMKRSAVVSAANHQTGPLIETDGTVSILSSGSDFNTSGETYHWFAYKDNGSGNLLQCDHAGNGQASRTLDYFNGTSLAAVLFKRDNTDPMVIAVAGADARQSGGAASNCPVTINPDGTLTVGQGSNVNIWSGSAGESCMAFGIASGSASIYETRYLGTGSARVLATPFSELDAVLIFPRAVATGNGALWINGLAAPTTLSLSNETAATVGSQGITSVSRGGVTLGTSARVNGAGVEYVMLAFARRRAGAFAPPTPARPLRSTRHIMLPSGVYLDAGSDPSLDISGAITLEFFGAPYPGVSGLTVPGSNNSSQAVQCPLMWRSNGADATDGSVGYGLAAIAGLGNPRTGLPLSIAVSSRFDLMSDAGTYDVDDNGPWQTGIELPSRCLSHVIATHNGTGIWRVYVDGQLVKVRDRDMRLADPARPNIASVPGQVLCFGARKRAGAPELGAVRKAIYGARIWARELTALECRSSYDSWFADNFAEAPADYVEQWLGSNATALELPASRNPSNAAVVAGGTAYVEG